jgi:hypothetical protein
LNSFQIRSIVYEEDSESTEFPNEFRNKIIETFSQDKIISEYIQKESAWEIVNDYKTNYADQDLLI